MRARRPETHTLAAAYALDALTRADRARFERHLARCGQCAQEISGLREATARLAAAAAAEPPPGLTERALAAASRTRQLRAATREPAAPGPARSRADGPLRRAWARRLALAVTATVIVLAAIVAVATGTARHQLAEDQRHSHTIAAILTARDATMMTAPVTGGGIATVVMSRRERALVFAAAGLRALPASQCYELWLMGPGGDKPAAMVPGPSNGMTGPVIATGLNAGDRLGLTVEPAGGTPHPTSAVILMLAL